MGISSFNILPGKTLLSLLGVVCSSRDKYSSYAPSTVSHQGKGGLGREGHLRLREGEVRRNPPQFKKTLWLVVCGAVP